MAYFPKYSERINFFFVVFSKDVPVVQEFGLISKIRAQFSSSEKVNRALVRAKSVTGTIGRLHNTSDRNPSSAKDVEAIRNAVQNFFIGAKAAFSRQDPPQLKTLWSLMAVMISSINGALAAMENSWLNQFGTVTTAELLLHGPADFFQILPICHKLIGNQFKPIAKQLQGCESSLNAVQFFTMRRRTK